MTRMLFLVVASAFVTLMSRELTNAQAQPFGRELGAYLGVTAYSNGENPNYGSDDYNDTLGTITGMKWQCVEYVNRFYLLTYHKDIRIPVENANYAYEYYSSANQRQLYPYQNGGSVPPGINDILCFRGGPKGFGHVAIIREVGSNYVTVAQQNYKNDTTDLNCRFNKVDSYTISDQGSLHVDGWLKNSPAAYTISAGQGAPTPESQNKFVAAYNTDGSAVLGYATNSVLQFTNTYYTPPTSGFYQAFQGGTSGSAQINYVQGFPAAYDIKFGFYVTYQATDNGIPNYFVGTGQPVYCLLVSPTDFESHGSSLSQAGSSYNWQPFSKGSMYYYVSSPLQSGNFNGWINYVWGDISSRYEKEGGRSGSLGLPLFSEVHYGSSDGWDWWFQWFEKGIIWYALQGTEKWTLASSYSGSSVYEAGQWTSLGWYQHSADGSLNGSQSSPSLSVTGGLSPTAGPVQPPPLPLAPSGSKAGINVATPITGAACTVGSMQTVTWSSIGATGPVSIKLSTDGGSTYPITLASNIANDGTEEVMIPSNPSDACRIKVESSLSTSVYGINPGNFSIISAPTIAVTNPQAGSIWTVGAVQSVTWSSSGVMGNVSLILSTDAGSSFSVVLAANTPNDGIETVTIPQSPSSACRIRVESCSNPGVFGTNPGVFTISPSSLLPVVTTSGTTSVLGTSAALSGTAFPNGLQTTAWFEYSQGSGLVNPATTSPQSIGAGTSAQVFTQTASGLSPSVEYFFRIAASNTAGTNRGAILSFKTTALGAPIVNSTPATSITSTTAQANGELNSRGGNSYYRFEYGLTTNYELKDTTFWGPQFYSTLTPISTSLYLLVPLTTYHYRLVAVNGSDTSRSNDISFTTIPTPPTSPTVLTGAASQLTESSAMLNGTANPNRAPTTVYFEWGLSKLYGNVTPALPIGGDAANVNVPANLTGLSANCIYHFRAVATNSVGTTYGNDMVFIAMTGQSAVDWQQTNGPLSGQVFALVIAPGGDVIAGGAGVYRSTNNGADWLSSGLTNTSTYCLGTDPNGKIFAGSRISLYRSTDNGTAWTEVLNRPTAPYFYSLALNSKGHVFAGSSTEGVYRSTNSGDSWTQVNSGLSSLFVYALKVYSDGKIFAGTENAGLFVSADNGESWIQKNNGLTNSLVQAIVVVPNGSVFVGTGDGVFRSTDAGEHWTQTNGGLASGTVGSLAVNSFGYIFAGPGDDGVFLSTDNGATWSAYNTGMPSSTLIKSFATNSSDYVLAGSNQGVVFRSTQSTIALPIQLVSFIALPVGNQVCLTWRTISEVKNYGFQVEKSTVAASTYALVKNGFVAGHGTTIEPHDYSFIDSTATSGRWYYRLKQINLDGTSYTFDPVAVDVLTVVASVTAIPRAYQLNQNYPNPFNPSTTIRYGLPQKSQVTLKVYNTLGQLVTTLVNGEQGAGYHEVRFDGSNLASGVYFYRLQAGNFVQTKKLLLLH